jgi:hypothetical protein
MSAYKMHKPASPCRKTCSTWHNEKMEAERYNYERMKRIHESETKVIIIEKPLIQSPKTPERVIHTPEPEEDFTTIDY